MPSWSAARCQMGHSRQFKLLQITPFLLDGSGQALSLFSMDQTAFSRKGGKAWAPAKTTPNRAKAAAFWGAVRAGQRPAPRRLRVPPPPETIADLLAAYCRQAGISRLEVLGSLARGDPAGNARRFAALEKARDLCRKSMNDDVRVNDLND
jgi:hypothetical protein